MMLVSIRDDVDHWFSEYFEIFIAISVGKAAPHSILSYWGVPLHVSGPKLSKWINSSEDLVAFFSEMQAVLRQAGYVFTEMLDKRMTIYSANAGRVETIMSRRRQDGSEMDRAAVSFEIRRHQESWLVISTTAVPTDRSTLVEVWESS